MLIVFAALLTNDSQTRRLSHVGAEGSDHEAIASQITIRGDSTLQAFTICEADRAIEMVNRREPFALSGALLIFF
jgi:hypothetical protein